MNETSSNYLFLEVQIILLLRILGVRYLNRCRQLVTQFASFSYSSLVKAVNNLDSVILPKNPCWINPDFGRKIWRFATLSCNHHHKHGTPYDHCLRWYSAHLSKSQFHSSVQSDYSTDKERSRPSLGGEQV